MQKIVPHLWFDTQAVEAADYYVSIFDDSKIVSKIRLQDTPSGDADSVSFELAGQRFMAISAGPYFTINPSISFLVSCKSTDEVERLWGALSVGGNALMELGSYPFSEKYGWIVDKFGVSWQLMYVAEGDVPQKITPTLMFVGDVCGKAEEAITFYTSVFHDSSVGPIARYGEADAPNTPGTIMHAAFTLENQTFAAMDSALEHDFSFNEAVSLIVNCQTQEEIDYYWDKLTAVPESEQCGWLKDKYGVSWQIVPTLLNELMASGDKQSVARVTQAFLAMKKFNVEELHNAALPPA